MSAAVDHDRATQCPDCGAQLIVNLRGRREFTCGRKDVTDGHATSAHAEVVSVERSCCHAGGLCPECGAPATGTSGEVTGFSCGNHIGGSPAVTPAEFARRLAEAEAARDAAMDVIAARMFATKGVPDAEDH